MYILTSSFVVAILLILSRSIVFALRATLFFVVFVLITTIERDFSKEKEFFKYSKSMFDSTLLYRKETQTIIFCFLDRKRKHSLMRESILSVQSILFLSFETSL